MLKGYNGKLYNFDSLPFFSKVSPSKNKEDLITFLTLGFLCVILPKNNYFLR